MGALGDAPIRSALVRSDGAWCAVAAAVMTPPGPCRGRGEVWVSDDGGRTWQQTLSVPFTAPRDWGFTEGSGFLLAQRACGGSSTPVVFATTDRGRHWAAMELPPSLLPEGEPVVLLGELRVASDGTGCLQAQDETWHCTSDTGARWTPVASPPPDAAATTGACRLVETSDGPSIERTWSRPSRAS